MSQAQAKVITIKKDGPVPLFPCNVLGRHVDSFNVKEDGVSKDLGNIDLATQVKLMGFDSWAEGDSIAEHLKVMHRICRGELPLGPRHADVLFAHPELYPDAWKGGVGNRTYVGFPGAVVYAKNSAEPMIVVLWWNGFGVSRSYASRAGENRQSKFMFAMFVGNPYAAK